MVALNILTEVVSKSVLYLTFSGALASILAIHLFSTHFLLISLTAAILAKKPSFDYFIHENLTVEFCALHNEQRSIQTGIVAE